MQWKAAAAFLIWIAETLTLPLLLALPVIAGLGLNIAKAGARRSPIGRSACTQIELRVMGAQFLSRIHEWRNVA